MKHAIKIFLLLISVFAFVSCSNKIKTEAEYPVDPETRRQNRHGKLLGDEGLIIFGKKKQEDNGGISGIGINSYLWRATLDTLSFMPLKSADPFGGVILTDWYEDPQTKGERFKVDTLILGKRLSSNAIKLTVFKQQLVEGNWREAPIDNEIARELEDKILTRARELKSKG